MLLFSQEELAAQEGQILKPEQAAQIEPNLPPPGYQRDELLAQRTDNLAQMAEKGPDQVRLPADAFNVDREIRNDIENDYMNIGANHPYLKTCWVNYVNTNGQAVWKKKAQGWAVATNREFPEAADLVKADNTIRVGDVLLMCIRIDQYLKIVKSEEDARLRQQYGLESEVHNIADKYPNVFKNVSTDDNPTLDPRTQEIIDRRRRAGQNTAVNTIARQMKQPGGVPGIPLPGQSRGRG
jgi:hypothetical protein